MHTPYAVGRLMGWCALPRGAQQQKAGPVLSSRWHGASLTSIRASGPWPIGPCSRQALSFNWLVSVVVHRYLPSDPDFVSLVRML